MKLAARTKAVVTVRARSVPVRRHPALLRSAQADVSHVGPARLQPALKVGAANDPLEREAEITAERISSMPSPEVAPLAPDPSSGRPDHGDQGAARRAASDDQPNLDSLDAAPPIPADHHDPNVPKEEDVDTTGLANDDMKEIESGTPENPEGEPPAEEDPPASNDQVPQAQPARSGEATAVGADGGPAPDDVTQRVAQPGSGRPLPASVRAFMEPRFGKDFSDVRVHDSADDRAAARRIGARAFTHKQHIWMGPGETVENRKLMAHELTHVVQQTRRGPRLPIKREVDTTEEAGEPEVRRDYVRDKAEKYARKVPGYRLISFILGKSPITGDRVDRNATNLLGALLGMLGPLGDMIFERLKETRVIEEAFIWIDKRLTRLNITWSRIKGIIGDILDYLMDWPSDVVAYAKKKFMPLVRDILTFVGEVKDKILEFIFKGALKLAGSEWAEKIWGIIKKAGSVISKILKDPLGFAKNLFAAVLKGFNQFGERILTHIKKGLLGWLFGAIKGLEITIPAKLDFKGLISIGLQVVGLTYAVFRAQLVKRLGKNGERKVAYLEKSVEVVKVLLKEGFAGIWQRVLQMIDNFKSTIIGGIQKFVIETLIVGGLSWLAKLSNPVGAIVGVVLAIYKIIKTFLERIGQILEVANSIFSSITAIASGKIQQAANFIENTIAATIPVVISFLAALVPISGITNAIRNIIKKLQAPVKKAMGKMITFLIKKSKKLFSKIIGKLNKKRKLQSANFSVGKARHRIYAEQTGKTVQVKVASKKGAPIEQVANETKAETKKLKGPEAKKVGGAISTELSAADDKTEKKEKKIKLNSKNKNMNKPVKKLGEKIKEGAAKLTQVGKLASTSEEVDETIGHNSPLFRFKQPRDPKVEGQAGTYSAMRGIIDQSREKTKSSDRTSYEVDHIVEKQIPKAIVENLNMLNPKKTKGERGEVDLVPSRFRKSKPKNKTTAERQPGKAPDFGKIGQGEYTDIQRDGPQLPGIILYKANHTAKGVKGGAVKRWIKEASGADDPHKYLKDKVRGQLATERKDVAKAYQGDKSASPEVSASINKGLEEIHRINMDVYGLGKDAPDSIPDASIKHATATSKSDVGFSPRGAGSPTPDFAKIEGNYSAYSSLPSGHGKYLEKDHIVEKSFPKQANMLTFGIDTIWQKIKITKPKGDDKEKAQAAAKRLEELGSAKVFAEGSPAGVRKYDPNSGKAILIYNPIHKAATSASSGARGPGDVVPGGAISSLSAAAQAFLESGKQKNIEAMRSAMMPGIKKKFEGATEIHARKVESEYDKELNNVRTANADESKKAQKQAAAQMQSIINKTKRNLAEARTYTSGLFS